MKNLRHSTLSLLLFFCTAQVALAQTNLAGRSYYNANIMAEEVNKLSSDKEMKQKMVEAKAKAVAKKEKELGRKMTDAERTAFEKDYDAQMKKALELTKKMFVIAIGVDFKNEKDAVMRTKIHVDDEAMKTAGVGWAKRKAMKAAVALAPSTQKVTYQVKGNLVILKEGKDLDTLTISKDGKYLYGKYDKKSSFRLPRTK